MEAGAIALLFSFFASIYSTLLTYSGVLKEDAKLLRKAEESIYITTFFITIASSTLFYYFLTDNFAIEYVFSHSNSDLPLLYKLSAFWAGSEGSLLLWAWTLSILIVVFIGIEKKDLLTAHSLLILLIIQDFFLLILLQFLNPFKVLDLTPPHGMGLNPLLETHEMAFHPPTLFIGYAGATIPFALSLAGVYLSEDKWVFRARKWILFTWIWLTAGIVIGAFWAYRVLGWGGFWGWDPVENASLLPWLTLTALMHSVMIQEARQGMKLWNVLLAFATFEFVILGTFLTRSGVIGSVHAFGQSNLSAPFTFLMFAAFAATLYITMERKEFIKSQDVIENVVSKETTFLLNNLLFTAFALSIFWGTIFPILSEAVVGYKATIGPKYYNQITAPLAFSLVALIGLCVAIPWRKSDGAKRLLLIFLVISASSFIIGLLAGLKIGVLAFMLSIFSVVLQIAQYLKDTKAFREEYGVLSFLKIILRKRRRYGGYTVHLGVILVFIGVVGTWVYATEHDLTLNIDEPYNVGGYTFIYRGYTKTDLSSKIVIEARVDIWRGESFLETAYPKIEKYFLRDQEVTRVEIIHEPVKDVYLSLQMVDEKSAHVRVKFNPLTNLIWMGTVIMISGGLLALTPRSLVQKIAEVKKE